MTKKSASENTARLTMFASSISAKNGIVPKQSSEENNLTNGLSDKKKIRLISYCLFSFIVFIYLFSQSLPGIYFIEQHYQRYEVTKSIVERFDLSIPKGSEGVIGIDGRTYSLYGLGWSILAVPFFLAGKYISPSPENFVLMLNPLAGAVSVTLVFLFSVALGYSRRSSLVVALFYGLGTFAWPLAKQPFDHVVETLFVLLSFYFMYRYASDNITIKLIISALCLGIAIDTRLVSILALPALLVLMGAGCGGISSFADNGKVYLRKMFIFISVLLPFVGLVLWYNYYRFGSLFETGYQLIAVRTGLDFFSGTPLLTGLRGLLASPGKGFFYYSPIAVFFFYSIIPFYKKHRWTAISFILLILSYLLFLSRNVYWHGDWAWGPRYLLPITPFFLIPIAELLDSKMWLGKNPSLVGLVYFVFSLSFAIQLAAVSVHFCNHFLHLRMDGSNLFIVNKGKGNPSIFEPNNEIYFDWRKSPILQQFLYVYEIGTGLGNYKSVQTIEFTEQENQESKLKTPFSVRSYFENPETTVDAEKLKALPPMRIFDYWWAYLYFEKNKPIVFVVLPIFFIITSVYGFQLVVLSRR